MRTKMRWMMALVVAALAVVVSGCGSSSSSSSSSASSSGSANSTSAASGASKGPINLGVIAPENSPAFNNGQIVAASQAAVNQLNASGGLDGHKVTLIYCNDKNDPNTTVTCARQMTSSHVIAIVGSGGGLSGNLAAGILGKAGIAELGINPVTTPEFNDSNVFLFSGGTAVSYPLISAYSSKVKLPTSVALAQNPDGEAISAGMAQVAKQAGLPFVAQVPVPATAADFSPLVGAAKPGTAKGLILELGYEQDAAFIHAAKGQGVSFTYLNSQEPDQGVSQALGTAGLNKYIYASPFPPLNPSSSHPIIAQFFTALKAMGSTDQANMVSQYPSYSAFSGYLAVQELDNLAKAGTIKSLTASGVMAGLKSITKVNVFGVLPAWDPNTPGPKGISRAGNPFYYINGYNNGTPRQILPTTVSTTGLVAGKGLTPSVIASHGL